MEKSITSVSQLLQMLNVPHCCKCVFPFYGLDLFPYWIPLCLRSLETKDMNCPQHMQILFVSLHSVWHNGLQVLECYSNKSNKSQ